MQQEHVLGTEPIRGIREDLLEAVTIKLKTRKAMLYGL